MKDSNTSYTNQQRNLWVLGTDFGAFLFKTYPIITNAAATIAAVSVRKT